MPDDNPTNPAEPGAPNRGEETERTPSADADDDNPGPGTARRSGKSTKGKPRAPKFAPQDLTDGRAPLEWDTKYTDPKAVRVIRIEAIYLAVHLFGIGAILVLLLLRIPESLLSSTDTQREHWPVLTKYSLGWVSGTLGGVLFSMKWLYHSVAKSIWHLDRHLWRLFTPHLSGGLAFAVLVMVSSGLLPIFNKTIFDSDASIIAAGFLIGYFSDSATAKMTDVAETIFGSTRK